MYPEQKRKLEKLLKEMGAMEEDEKIFYITIGENALKNRCITIVCKREGEE
jgi:hypothetical protein